jgi:hypothetical protein
MVSWSACNWGKARAHKATSGSTTSGEVPQYSIATQTMAASIAAPPTCMAALDIVR